jgi:Lrp/AsnC family transcriptional regulator, leucine-responsive regulatory protein
MASSQDLDEVDRKILDSLRDDARQPATEIAKHLDITPGAVRRRIERLEEREIINRYTVVLNHEKLGPSVEAFLELTFEAGSDVPRLLSEAVALPEVREASTIAGDPDAIVRLRVENLELLRKIVIDLRNSMPVTNSKTLVALDRYRHVYLRDE